ncbi:hypothetical protein FGE12_24500 [Aggregicoccus sp. 17bor-14]|uniref:hypothetical protein n=1 Tax=Myxococcaceae TaxID=31 RepID=UPI00129C3DDA|nr:MULTISPECIES: hypothetical protein [Myxococcaceae]MBF5045591.1 hypothetical protein [Simulacricoccus sp. 17bor-14]MRI91328.1 hypothetical protein [Aggregicoccus sp. 17bor-14]
MPRTAAPEPLRPAPWRRPDPLSHTRLLFALLACALLLPHFVTVGPHHRVGLAGVCGGDEPHYLVQINSVLEDLDLDVSNNYTAVHEGGREEGEFFRGDGGNHHTVVNVNGRYVLWSEAFVWDGRFEHGRGEDGHARVPGAPRPKEGAPEWSFHPPGATMLALLLWPFRGTRGVEVGGLLLAALATLLAAVALRSIVRSLGGSVRLANGVMLIGVLCTPVWNYARTFFNEPFLLAFCLGAYALHFRQRPLLAGLLIALGMQMKPPFGLLLVPLWVDLLLQRSWRRLALLSLLPALSALGVLALNAYMLGSPFKTAIVFQVGSLREGALGMLFDWNRGLLPLAPVMAFGLLGWPFLLRGAARRPALLCACGFALYAGLMAAWVQWHGAWCYGPRLFIPVVPFVALGLMPVLAGRWRRWLVGPVVALALVSFAINFVATYQPCRLWGRNPIDLVRPGARPIPF